MVATCIRAFPFLRVLLSMRTSENTGGDEESRRIAVGDFNAGNEIRAAGLLNSLLFFLAILSLFLLSLPLFSLASN